MKKGISICMLFVLFMSSCSQAAAATEQAGVPPISTETAAVSTPAVDETSSASTVQENSYVKPYDDVRNMEFAGKNWNFDRSLIESLWFDDTTIWPADTQALAEEILEAAKNPGLGVRSLHDQGITGKGVTVAIIDQNLLLDHPEFSGKIIEYYDTGTEQPDTEGSMHAPSVTSLLVGSDIGTAPDARVYFAAVPSWKADAKYYADALNWIISKNESLPEGQKIRAVSVSAAPSGEGSPFTANNADWDEAYQKATEAGILVLDCSDNHGIAGPCTLDASDPESPAKCTPGWPDKEIRVDTNLIYVPTSPRTTAIEYTSGQYAYQYTGRGGMSWGIPYLTGVLAMGWQVNPDLSNEQIVKLLFDSATVREDGGKIIDPVHFIQMVKDTVK